LAHTVVPNLHNIHFIEKVADMSPRYYPKWETVLISNLMETGALVKKVEDDGPNEDDPLFEMSVAAREGGTTVLRKLYKCKFCIDCDWGENFHFPAFVSHIVSFSVYYCRL
jgi:hypothetical protein